jgi:hypothetical protein
VEVPVVQEHVDAPGSGVGNVEVGGAGCVAFQANAKEFALDYIDDVLFFVLNRINLIQGIP